jgi:drug/metabolite transporter (DMT)-like permease
VEFQAYDIALIPVIVTLVGLLGRLGVPARWLPLAAIILGLAGAFVYIAPNDPAQAVLVGLVMGLSAVGAYSGVKNTVQSRD